MDPRRSDAQYYSSTDPSSVIHPAAAAAAAPLPPRLAEGPPTGLCEGMPDCLKEAMFVAHLHAPLAAWAGGVALPPGGVAGGRAFGGALPPLPVAGAPV